jgi:hypothetical protein
MSEAELFSSIPALLPIDFFAVSMTLPYMRKGESKKLTRYLPSFSPMQENESFAELALGWSEEGIVGVLDAMKPFEDSSLPDYYSGDSLELFIDTRDMKDAGFATRFCHHFVILASPVQDVQALEVTKFRTDDTHALSDGSLITVKGLYDKKSYRLEFFLPKEILHGYEPQTFTRLGLCFKVNRYKGLPQYFTLSSECFDILQHPSLWPSFHLINA